MLLKSNPFTQISPKSNQIHPNLTNSAQKMFLVDVASFPAPTALSASSLVVSLGKALKPRLP